MSDPRIIGITGTLATSVGWCPVVTVRDLISHLTALTGGNMDVPIYVEVGEFESHLVSGVGRDLEGDLAIKAKNL